ncbi:MAG: hypothetical protein KTR35_08900 [Gammaproteobacteria bacterium]|nr:hypothetical protein [Gammaproteobacteria bacterium]
MLGLARIAEKGPLVAISLAIGLLLVASVLPQFIPLLDLVSLPLTILSGAVMSYVCLRFGQQAAFQALFGGAAVLLLMSIVSHGNIWQLPLTGLMVWLPPALAALVLKRTVSLELALLLIAGVGVIVAFIVQLNAQAILDYWQSMLDLMMARAREQQSELFADEEFAERLKLFSVAMLRAIGVSVMAVAVGCLFIARSWQAQLFNVGGFQKEFHALKFGRAAALVALPVIVLSMVTSFGWLDSLALVLIFLFCLQGLAVVHSLVKQRNMSNGVLVVMYAFLILPHTMYLIGALGLTENLYPLRKS